MRTRTELINQALLNLGAVAVGQAVDADTSSLVDGLIDGLIAELERRDVIYIQDITTYGIEDEFFQPLARILAWRAAPAFGAQNDSGQANARNTAPKPAEIAGMGGCPRPGQRWGVTH